MDEITHEAICHTASRVQCGLVCCRGLATNIEKGLKRREPADPKF
jgi:hypothetical protein